MKKFKVLLPAFMLAFVLIVTPAMANGGSSWANQGTDYEVGGSYDANGKWISGGKVTATAFAPVGGKYEGSNVAGAYSGQKVESKAYATGFWPTKPYQSANVHGTAYQWSSTGVDLGNGNWAVGSQESWSGYNASDNGYFSAHAAGSAETYGGTLAGAYRHDTANSSIGMAGAVTGSFGFSNAYCNNYDTWTGGRGKVGHGSYASNHGAQARTGGSASYGYNTNGGHHAAGYGFAGTFGVSKVTHNPGGATTATARSFSFSSSGGRTNSNGGVYMSSFN